MLLQNYKYESGEIHYLPPNNPRNFLIKLPSDNHLVDTFPAISARVG